MPPDRDTGTRVRGDTATRGGDRSPRVPASPRPRVGARLGRGVGAGLGEVTWHEPAPAVVSLSWLTVEAALVASIALLAALLRFSGLGHAPLGIEESRTALGAWQVFQGGVPEAWREPLVSTLAFLSLFLFGSSDLALRAFSAVAGVALVVAVWWMRPLLGRTEALFAALFLAFSPIATHFSRLLAGDAVSALLSLALLLVALRYLARPEAEAPARARDLVVVGVLLGLLLQAGGQSLSFLAIFGLFLAGLAASGRVPPRLARAWLELRANPRQLWPAALAAIVAAELVATALLLNPGGTGLRGPLAWVGQFDLRGGVGPWFQPLIWLGIYEPLILVAGTAGAVAAVRYLRRASAGQRPWSDREVFLAFLVFWAAGGLLLALIAGRASAGPLLVPVLPLGLLGGWLVARLAAAARWEPGPDWPLFLAAPVVLIGFIYIILSLLARPDRQPQTVQWVGLGACAVLLVFFVAGALSRFRPSAGPALSLLGFVVLAGWSVHSGTWLDHRPGSAEILGPLPSSASLRDLANLLDEVYERRRGKETQVAIGRELRAPLAWYLRERPNVRFMADPPSGPTAIVARASKPPADVGKYLTVRHRTQAVSTLPTASLSVFWRWLTFREGPPPGEEWILYINMQ